MGIDRRMSSYKTYYSGTSDRITNLQLGVGALDDTFVPPGGTFSLNGAIGERTIERGFRPAPVIIGNEYAEEVGGGTSQVATTAFNAAWEAGLRITERHPHSLALTSMRDMPGFDAAVDTRGVDLRWRNDTPHSILISAELSGATLTVTLWGQGDGRTTTLRGPTVRKAPGAQLTTMRRVVVDANGIVIRSDIVQSRYAVPHTAARTDARSARN